MLFNSIEFLFFLSIVFLLYWFMFKPLKWQNLLVVTASYVFYGWWDWRFLLLIAFTTLCSFISGLLIEHYEEDRKKQKWISAANMEAKGAKAVLIPSVIREAAFKYEKERAYEINSFFHKYGYAYNSKPEEHVMPDSCAWNTDYHMNYKGVERNTDVLIRELKLLQ